MYTRVSSAMWILDRLYEAVVKKLPRGMFGRLLRGQSDAWLSSPILDLSYPSVPRRQESEFPDAVSATGQERSRMSITSV